VQGMYWRGCTIWSGKSEMLFIVGSTVPVEGGVVEIIDELELEVVIDSHEDKVDTGGRHLGEAASPPLNDVVPIVAVDYAQYETGGGKLRNSGP
jgi:hypothetical protein